MEYKYQRTDYLNKNIKYFQYLIKQIFSIITQVKMI